MLVVGEADATPDAVIGLGGYSAGPVVMMAALRGIPTMLLFKGGQPVAQKVGAAPRSQIQQWLEGNL